GGGGRARLNRGDRGAGGITPTKTFRVLSRGETAIRAKNLNRMRPLTRTSRAMSLDRRHFLSFTAGGAAAASEPFTTQSAQAAPQSVLGIDALYLGVRAGSFEDQSRALQQAIDHPAGARV